MKLSEINQLVVVEIQQPLVADKFYVYNGDKRKIISGPFNTRFAAVMTFSGDDALTVKRGRELVSVTEKTQNESMSDEMCGFTAKEIKNLESKFEEHIPSLTSVEILSIREVDDDLLANVMYEGDDGREKRGTITFTCLRRGHKVEDLVIKNATGKFKVDQSVFS